MIFAYLDPGTLTFLMQCLVAVVVTCSLYLGIFWSKIKTQCSALFVRRSPQTAGRSTLSEGRQSEEIAEETIPFPKTEESKGSDESNPKSNAA